MKPLQYLKYLILFAGAVLMATCTISPNYSDSPEIEFVGFSKNVMVQGFNSDTTTLTISFTDGDGDLGIPEGEEGTNVVLRDNRTGDVYDRFRIPAIPEEGANNGVSGEIRMVVLTTCCVFPDSIPNCESPPQYPTNDLSFTVQIEDREGNLSNELITSTISLLCQ